MYGARARIGYAAPPFVTEVFPYEFYMMAPQGVSASAHWAVAHAIDDIECFFNTFVSEIDTGVNFQTAFPLPMIVEMQESRFLKTIEVPIAAVSHVRTQLVQPPQVIGSDPAHDETFVFTISTARQEADLWIKVISNFRVAKTG